MGVQFNGRGKIKSYNYNGRCVILDEPCFKRGVDCSPCTRIQNRNLKSVRTPVNQPVNQSIHEPAIISEPCPEVLDVSVHEIKPEHDESASLTVNDEPSTDVMPTEVVTEQNDYVPIVEQLKQTESPTKKKSFWNKFIGFMKSIFKPRNKKPRNKKPKQPRTGGGNIYVWKNRKEGFGKKRVRNL